ncbi:DUF6518 family protein [Herbiconiux daphne]|uniref:DUF6518 family protein n=1 Tax=Herbiconiux daphne TaxID=2970914 RepID=A0ABT2H576_9MICO|nr:DUF6518 family protein [Herbiconiux daphne]MCS5735081.1 DUF6518 family protein [Herbiconiux daphne]
MPPASGSANDPRSRGRRRNTVLSIGLVVVGSVVVGGLTSPAQQYLPDAFRSLANSAGGWSMFAFVFVWLSKVGPRLGAILGALAFILMVESYGAVSAVRGYDFADPFTSMWIPIGLLAGLAIGASATLVRRGSRLRVVGTGLLSLVLVVEGVYGLTILGETTSPVYWLLEIAAGTLFTALALVRLLNRRHRGL